MPTVCFRIMSSHAHSHTHNACVCKTLSCQVPDGECAAGTELSRPKTNTWTFLNLTHSWHIHVSVCASFFLHLDTMYTLTNRKWCQSLSPGRQRRLLRYCDSGFLFLSFSSAPLSHGLTQIDTSPSVAGVHPSLNHWPALGARLSFTLSSSHSLSPSPSICRYLTIELLAPARAHKFFSISFINSTNVHGSIWWTVVLNKMVNKLTSSHDALIVWQTSTLVILNQCLRNHTSRRAHLMFFIIHTGASHQLHSPREVWFQLGSLYFPTVTHDVSMSSPQNLYRNNLWFYQRTWNQLGLDLAAYVCMLKEKIIILWFGLKDEVIRIW